MSQKTIKKNLSCYLESLGTKESKILQGFFTKGHCYSFCVCRGAMRICGKLNWWQTALIVINNWKNTQSFDDEIQLPGTDSPIKFKNLFDRVVHYIVFHHGAKKDIFLARNISKVDYRVFIFKPHEVRQADILNPDQPFFELLNGKKIQKVALKCTINFIASENFNEFLTKLYPLLLAEKNLLCILKNRTHGLELNILNNAWTLYDPNYDHSSIATMVKNFDKSDVEGLQTEINLRLRNCPVSMELVFLMGFNREKILAAIDSEFFENRFPDLMRGLKSNPLIPAFAGMTEEENLIGHNALQ